MEEGFFEVVEWSKNIAIRRTAIDCSQEAYNFDLDQKAAAIDYVAASGIQNGQEYTTYLMTFLLSVHSRRVPATMWNSKVVGGKAVSIGTCEQELLTAQIGMVRQRYGEFAATLYIVYDWITLYPLTPNNHYSGRTAPLASKRCILYIYSTNIGTEYFKHGIYSSFFSLQNAVCFIILMYLVPVLFTFYIQSVLKLKK